MNTYANTYLLKLFSIKASMKGVILGTPCAIIWPTWVYKHQKCIENVQPKQKNVEPNF